MHHHMAARAALSFGADGVTAHGPAARFSPSVTSHNPPGEHTEIATVLPTWQSSTTADDVHIDR